MAVRSVRPNPGSNGELIAGWLVRTIGRLSEALQKTSVFRKLLGVFERENVPYCILGQGADAIELGGRDVDIVTDLPMDRLVCLLREFCEQEKRFVLRIRCNESAACFFTVGWLNSNGDVSFINLDFCNDYCRDGRFLLSGRELLDCRNRDQGTGAIGGLYVAAPRHEFAYYLTKQLDKGALMTEHFAHLTREWRLDPQGCRSEIARFWAAEKVDSIAHAAETGSWEAILNQMRGLQKDLHKAVSVSWATHIRTKIAHWLRCIRQPAGLFVVFLGPDGSGKSTAMERMIEVQSVVFPEVRRFHFRPRLGSHRDAGGPVTNPHGQQPRSALAALAKTIYLLGAYNVGYVTKIRPVLARSGLVVFDRYFPDMLVDPRRYRYADSSHHLSLFARWIPQPDLYVIMNAGIETLRQRKQEVSCEETLRQKKAYVELSRDLNQAIIVNSDQPLTAVVADISQVILPLVAEKALNRFGRT